MFFPQNSYRKYCHSKNVIFHSKSKKILGKRNPKLLCDCCFSLEFTIIKTKKYLNILLFLFVFLRLFLIESFFVVVSWQQRTVVGNGSISSSSYFFNRAVVDLVATEKDNLIHFSK